MPAAKHHTPTAAQGDAMTHLLSFLIGCTFGYDLQCPSSGVVGQTIALRAVDKGVGNCSEQVEWVILEGEGELAVTGPTNSLVNTLVADVAGTVMIDFSGRDSGDGDECTIEISEAEPPDPVEVDLVAVGPITFQRGCVGGPDQCTGSELPLRDITLSAYSIERTEVSVAAYEACVTAGVCSEPGESDSTGDGDTGAPQLAGCTYHEAGDFDDHPVNCVTHEQASNYCAWRGLRLPTEAEWEAAARGDDARLYPWGDTIPTCDLANIYDPTTGTPCYGSTLPVDSFAEGASVFGALQMAGNVGEWVSDWFGDGSYYAESPDTDPQGPSDGPWKVTRGGEYDRLERFARTSTRSAFDPNMPLVNTGFRCARSD